MLLKQVPESTGLQNASTANTDKAPVKFFAEDPDGVVTRLHLVTGRQCIEATLNGTTLETVVSFVTGA